MKGERPEAFGTPPPIRRWEREIENSAAWRRWIRAALAEDIGPGDATTRALVPPGATAAARIVARAPGVICGTRLALSALRAADARIRGRVVLADGARAEKGAVVLELQGPARGLLTAERTALNLLQRLSGIATLTRRFVEAVAPHPVAILDTRKTTPGLRRLEKYAVRCGGGVNHRFGLYDRILIKDNHRAFWAGAARRRLADAVRATRARYPRLPIEIEVDSETELRDALDGRPDWVLLDNMTPARLRRCVRLCAGRARTEASGGVTLKNVRAIAATGVDAISIGALTHSAPALDLSMEFR